MTRGLALLLFAAVSLCAQPTISRVGHDGVTDTIARIHWTAGFEHDAASDTILRSSFTTAYCGNPGGTVQITVDSTAGLLQYNSVLIGGEWGFVKSIDSPTLATIQMLCVGYGGSDIEENLQMTRDGMTISCSAGTCTATLPYPMADYWLTGHHIRIIYARTSNLNSGTYYVMTRTDSTHLTFSSSAACSPCDFSTDPDVWLQSGEGQVHSSGETVSNLGTDEVVCYGNPGGSAGTYPNQVGWQADIEAPGFSQQNKHYVYVTNQTPSSTIHYIVMSTPRQFGASSCSSPGAHTGVSADQTLTFAASSGASDPTAPSNVSFSTALPGSYADSKVVGSDCPDLQACIDTARSTAGNHELKITAGTTISGTFSLPAQTNGSLITTIRSSAADVDLPAPGACIPPLVPDQPSPCIDNPSYAAHLATLKAVVVDVFGTDTIQPVFYTPPYTASSGFHFGPGLKIESDPLLAPTASMLALLDLSHAQGSGLYDHNSHPTDVTIDRCYFYQKSIFNGALAGIYLKGGERLAVVDNVVAGVGNWQQDFASIQNDGQDDSDSGVIIRNNRLQGGVMVYYMSDNGHNTADVLFQRNYLRVDPAWRTSGNGWVHLEQFSISAATNASTAQFTTVEEGKYDYTATPSMVLSFVNLPAGWASVQARTFKMTDGTLLAYNCTGGTCTIQTSTAHGFSTGDRVYTSGFAGPPCHNESARHTITVTDSTHFTYSSALTANCGQYQAQAYGPVYQINATSKTQFTTTPAINSTAMGAIGSSGQLHIGFEPQWKNIWECKTCKRIEVSGNILEGGYAGSQQEGQCFTLTLHGGHGYRDPSEFASLFTISDINIHDNWCRSSISFVDQIGLPYEASALAASRIRFANNLATDMSCKYAVTLRSCDPYAVIYSGITNHAVLEHNTFLTESGGMMPSGGFTPPAIGDWTWTNNILQFGGQLITGIGHNLGGTRAVGAQAWMTGTADCPNGRDAGKCAVSNPPWPDSFTWRGNVVFGTATDAGGPEDFTYQRALYGGGWSGHLYGYTSGLFSEYQDQYWPSKITGVDFAGLTAISSISGSGPAVTLNVSTMGCVPDQDDLVIVSGALGAIGINGTVPVMSATSTTIDIVAYPAGTYGGGGKVMPLTGKCNAVTNWALASSSRYKAGTWASRTPPDQVYTVDGSGPASDDTAVGANIDTLSAAIAGCYLSPDMLPNATVTQSYSQGVTATGCSSSSYTIGSGSLTGSGLSLNSSTGAITGTVSGSPATYSFTIDYDTASTAYTIDVAARPAVTGASLPNGTQGSAYSQSISTTGGTGTVTCAITAGSLSGSGITLGSNCSLTGTAGTPATYSFTVTATDANAISSTGQAFSLTIDAAGGGPPPGPGTLRLQGSHLSGARIQ